MKGRTCAAPPTLLAATVAIVGAPLAPAFAQSADEVVTGDAVTVTARRQTERMVDVPGSVTVITSQTLQRTGIDKLSGVVQLTPGVSIVQGAAEAGDTQVNIRGINGARDAESSVALVIDGILKTNTRPVEPEPGPAAAGRGSQGTARRDLWAQRGGRCRRDDDP